MGRRSARRMAGFSCSSKGGRTMRITLHTLGTRGDMQPFLALSVGLKRRGHDVLMVAPAQFEEAAAAEGVDLHPMPRDRKSTRLNSSHVKISYAVFCLKKKIEKCKMSVQHSRAMETSIML